MNFPPTLRVFSKGWWKEVELFRAADPLQGSNRFLRELLIPFGNIGYVALFEIEDASTVTILAVRHQLEDNYH